MLIHKKLPFSGLILQSRWKTETPAVEVVLRILKFRLFGNIYITNIKLLKLVIKFSLLCCLASEKETFGMRRTLRSLGIEKVSDNIHIHRVVHLVS